MSHATRIAVVANPGAGKTAVLVERIKCRLSTIRPRDIVVLTFTNAGAHELSRRLEAEGITPRYVGTLHGYCFRLLQKHGHLLGYRAGGINLLTEEFAEDLLQQVADELLYKGSKRKLEAGCKTAEAAAGAGPYGVICQEYRHRLKRNNLVDYDTVLEVANRLLRMFPAVRDHEAMAELLVDEAQDSAQIDWEVYLSIPATTLFVVGDPDQSIFGFRGAWPSGFRDYATSIAIETVILDVNYRSGVAVCRAASDLIAHNTGRVEKRVVPAHERGDIVTFTKYGDDRSERRGVRLLIEALVDYQPKDVAILCRRNDLVTQFRDELEANGIQTAGRGEKPDLPADWRRAMDVLSILHDPRNDLIAERIIPKDKLEKCKRETVQAGLWLSMVLGAKPDGKSWQRFGVITPKDNVVEALSFYDVSKESQLLIGERISLLPQPEPTLVDLLHDLHEHERWVPADNRNGVTVCTIHAAKGREWPVVLLPAWEEGILPALRRDTTPASIEEERRLAFVAMTRAQQRLHVSCAGSRYAWGKVAAQQPSRFVVEAGLTPPPFENTSASFCMGGES